MMAAGRAFLWAGLIVGCSEGTGPDLGSFQARLSGAKSATLSGSSDAGPVFTEQFPDARFTIRMFASRGDTIRAIALYCPGLEPLPPGTTAVTESGQDSTCAASYSLVVSSPENGLNVVERTAASSGSVRISDTRESSTAGSFSFSGILVVGLDSVGTLNASGTFNASF